MSDRIDGNLVALLVALGIAWLAAGVVKTPAGTIQRLSSGGTTQEWAAALTSDDRVVRQFARENIFCNLDQQDLGQLALSMARSGRETEQAAGLWLLGRVDVAGRAEVAAGFLNSPDPAIVEAALDVLAESPWPDVHDKLVQLSASETSSVQKRAVKALAALANPEDSGLFLDLLRANDPDVRRAAHDAILRVAGMIPEIESRLAAVASASDLTAAREAVMLLGEIGSPSSLDYLFELLESGLPALGNDIAQAIGMIDGEEARAKALEMYRVGDGRARRGAARVLLVLGDKRAARDLLETALNPMEDLWLRYYSMEALATCGTADEVAPIIEFLERGDDDQRLGRVALEALGGIDGDTVLEVYDRVLSGEEDFGLDADMPNSARIAVVNGLSRMPSEESRRRLRELLDRISLEDTDLMIAVIRALGVAGTPEDIPALSEAAVGRMLLKAPAMEAIRQIEQRYPDRGDAEGQ